MPFDSNTPDDLFDVTPKEYAEAIRRHGKGMTDRGAQKYFKRQLKKSSGDFARYGERVFARRGWLEERFGANDRSSGQQNTNGTN